MLRFFNFRLTKYLIRNFSGMATGGAALSTTAKPTTTTSWRSKRATSSSSSTRRPRTRTGWRDTYWVTPPSADYFQCLSSTCSQIDKVVFLTFFLFLALHSRRRRRLLSPPKFLKLIQFPTNLRNWQTTPNYQHFFRGKSSALFQVIFDCLSLPFLYRCPPVT